MELELLTLPSGDVAALAFSNVERLVQRLGEHQPWVMVSGRKFEQLTGERAVSTMVIDPPEDMCHPVWTAQAVRDLGEVRGGGLD